MHNFLCIVLADKKEHNSNGYGMSVINWGKNIKVMYFPIKYDSLSYNLQAGCLLPLPLEGQQHSHMKEVIVLLRHHTSPSVYSGFQQGKHQSVRSILKFSYK